MPTNVLRLSSKEVAYQRSQFYESQKLNGVHSQIRAISKTPSITHDFYGDLNVNRDEVTETIISTYITFDSNPPVKTLKSLGWYVDSDSMPILAYIPVYYQDDNGEISTYTPTIDDIISLPSDPTLEVTLKDTQEFLIKKLVGQGYPDVIYYIANLVPHRRNLEDE